MGGFPAIALLAAVALPQSAVRAGQESGSTSPEDVSLPELDGEVVSLAELLGAHDAVVLAWRTLDCPMSRIYAPRLQEVAGETGEGVSFWWVFSSPQDEPAEVRAARDAAAGAPIRFVHDAGAGLARRFQVTRSTEVLAIDADGKVRYRGALDDQYGYRRRDEGGVGTYRKEKPDRHYLRDALAAMREGRSVEVQRTDARGCAIRWEWAAPDAVTPETPTYHGDLEAIFREHCVRCHWSDGPTPFALEDFDHARDWAPMIREVVTERRMPPWNADPSIGEFANDPRLSEAVIQRIQQWVDSGAPAGDPAQALPPVAPRTPVIAEPDMVVATPAFVVPATGTLPYRYVEVTLDHEEDRWVQAAQVVTDTPEVIHHVLVFVDTNPSFRPASRRPWRPRFVQTDILQGMEPGEERRWLPRLARYTSDFLVGEGGGLNGYFVSALPGGESWRLPEGRAVLLPAGAKLTFQIHYTPGGEAVESHTALELELADGPPEEAVDTRAVATVIFEIPPGAADHQVVARTRFVRGAKILALLPHMHLRGKAFEYRAILPDGSTRVLLSVPNYDFDWQHRYEFAEPPYLPPGTTLEVVATFDNSADNPYNPDPTRPVFFGLQTEEEMMIGYYEAIWDSR